MTNRNDMKKILTVALLLLSSVIIQAIPAFPGPIPVVLENGQIDTIFAHGDEWMSWTTDRQGNWVEYDGKHLHQVARMEWSEMEHQQLMRANAAAGDLKRNIPPRGLVILVEFPDCAFKSCNTQAGFDSLFNAPDYHYDNGFVSAKGNTYTFPAYGSARKYFQDQSMGQYNPQFDVVGPVMADSSYIYYGKNSGSIKDINIGKLIRESVIKADSVVDYTQYDQDADGYVDFVYVIYAGYSEADNGVANYIWPKKWTLAANGGVVTLDGKKVNTYVCGSELNRWGTRDGIGTFCHEFSHVFGLKDFYVTMSGAKDTTRMIGVHKTLGTWDLMDYGCYCDNGNRPPSYSAYERWFCGWLTPTPLIASQKDTLEYIGTSNQAYILTGSTQIPQNELNPSPADFYLIENRQFVGWDSVGLHDYHRNYASVVYAAGHGLMIQEIHFSSSKWDSNTINNDSLHMGVSVVSADGWRPNLVHYYRSVGRDVSFLGKQGDLFPAGDTDFFMPYDTAFALLNIQETATGEIIFDFTDGTTTDHEALEAQTTDAVRAIYTPTGIYMGTDIHKIPAGLYIIQTDKDVLKLRLHNY